MSTKTYTSDHSTTLMLKLNSERKSSGKYCDATVIGGSKKFQVHKCVVCSLSDFFDRMFTVEASDDENMQYMLERKLNIEDVNEETMEIILEFIYCGVITITNGNVDEVIKQANYLEIPYLGAFCEEFLLNNLDKNNCLKIKAYGELYNFEAVTVKANGMLREEFEWISKTNCFKQLSLDNVLKLLNLKDSKMTSEEIVFHSIVDWVKHDIVGRKQHFNKLFREIELERLSADFLDNVVAKEDLVTESYINTKFGLIKLLPCLEENEIESVVSQNKQKDGFLVIRTKFYFYDIVDKLLYTLKDLRWHYTDRRVVRFNDEVVYALGESVNYPMMKIFCKDLTSVREEPVPMTCTVALRFIKAVVCNGYLYVSSEKGESTFFHRYDCQFNRWEFMKEMNERRYRPALVALAGKVYAIGGHGSSSAECYDPQDNEWTMITPMDTEERGRECVAVVLNDEIYAIGGSDCCFKDLLSVVKFNPVSGLWSRVASLNIPISPLDSACVVGGKIYVVRGCANIIEAYDPSKDVWTIEGISSRCLYTQYLFRKPVEM